MFKAICLAVLFTYAISSDCPTWECKDTQTNTADSPHCVEFTTDKIYLADKSKVCTSTTETTCILLQAVYELNYYSDYNGVSSSFCTETPSTYGTTYWFTVETSWGSSYYNDNYFYFSFEKDCDEYTTYSYLCDYVDEDEAEETEEDIDEGQDEADGTYTWNTCTSDSDCQSNECLCVPSTDTDGRCGTSVLDLYVIMVAQTAAACDPDEVSVCTLTEFLTSENAVLWISILEEDLDCAASQTWELENQGDYDIQGALDWYNKASAQIIVFLSGVLLSLL